MKALAFFLLFSIAVYFFLNETIGSMLFVLGIIAMLFWILLNGKRIAKGIHSDLAKAEPQHPPATLFQEALNETGKKASEQIWQSSWAWSSRNLPKNLGNSSQKLIDKFFELFK